MNTTLTWTTASVLLTALTLAATYEQDAAAPTPGPRHAEDAPPAPSAITPSHRTAIPAPAPDLRMRPPPWPSLAQALHESNDWRTFAWQAQRQTEAGGLFYATLAVRWCTRVRDGHPVLQGPQPVIPGSHSAAEQVAQQRAFDRVKARCASFTDEELSTAHIDPLHDLALSHADPLALAARRLHREGRSPDRTTREAAVAQVLARPDPWLLEDLGWRLALDTGPDGRPALWFDGVAYPIATDPPIAAAFSLVPCRLGLPCDADDITLALPCAIDGECYASRDEQVRRTLGRDDPQRFAEISQWADRIAQAIRQGRADAFARRR